MIYRPLCMFNVLRMIFDQPWTWGFDGLRRTLTHCLVLLIASSWYVDSTSRLPVVGWRHGRQEMVVAPGMSSAPRGFYGILSTSDPSAGSGLVDPIVPLTFPPWSWALGWSAGRVGFDRRRPEAPLFHLGRVFPLRLLPMNGELPFLDHYGALVQPFYSVFSW